MPLDIDALKRDVLQAAEKHEGWGGWDAWLYNGGTVIILLCTSVATYLPNSKSAVVAWLPQVLTGLATFWVALDRALSFGPRWKHHMAQASGYRIIYDKLTALHGVEESDRPAATTKILAQLEAVRSRENTMPGVHGGNG